MKTKSGSSILEEKVVLQMYSSRFSNDKFDNDNDEMANSFYMQTY